MQEHSALNRTEKPKRVIVVGAGMAGLCCAYELQKAAHHVRVLEARERPGGRVWTMRGPEFSGSLFAELGAVFIPDNHPLPLHYINEFGLELFSLPAPLKSTRHVSNGVLQDESYNELTTKSLRMMMEIARKHVAEKGAWPDAQGTGWASLDQISLADFLRSEQMDKQLLSALQSTLIGNFGFGIETYSALAAIRQLPLMLGRKHSFAIVGGNDRLPLSFAKRLADAIEFSSQLIAIEHNDSLKLKVRRKNGFEDLEADSVVLAIPGKLLHKITMTPGFSEAKQEALQQQKWTPVSKLFLRIKKRFWSEDAPTMIASSNEPAIRWMIDQRIVSEENILTAYAMGKAAADLASMIPAEQKNWVRNEALKAFPELRGSVAELEVFPYSWDLDEFACGGYPWPAIGQDQVPNILASPEGKMHFAGEHTTHHFAWIQGAMESGLRAAKEVHEAP